MQCPACGNEAEGRFCPACGAQLQGGPTEAPTQTPAPAADDAQGQPQEYAQQPPPTYYAQPQQPASPPKKKRGCLWGCLITALVVLLVSFAGCAWLFHLPERWGLVASPAETMFEQSPDPFAGDLLVQELETQGFVAEGTDVWVLPAMEREGTVAHFVLDESRGFAWNGEYESPVESLMVLVATSDVAADYSIGVVGVDYRDAVGEEVVVLAAPTDVVRAYAQGSATREDFLLALEGRSTIGQLVESQTGWLR